MLIIFQICVLVLINLQLRYLFVLQEERMSAINFTALSATMFVRGTSSTDGSFFQWVEKHFTALEHLSWDIADSRSS